MMDEQLSTYDEFVIAAAQDVTTTYEIGGSLCDLMTRHEMFQVYLRNLVNRQMRERINNHNDPAPGGHITLPMARIIAKSGSTTLNDKINYRGIMAR